MFWPIPIGLLIHLFYVFPAGQLPGPLEGRAIFLRGLWSRLGLAIFFQPEPSRPLTTSGSWANPLVIGSNGTSPVGGILIGGAAIGMLVLAAGGFVAILTEVEAGLVVGKKPDSSWALYGGTLFPAAFILQSFLSESGVRWWVPWPMWYSAPRRAAIPILMNWLSFVMAYSMSTVSYLPHGGIFHRGDRAGPIYVVGAVYLPVRIIGTSTPPVFVAGTTLLLALIFNPLHAGSNYEWTVASIALATTPRQRSRPCLRGYRANSTSPRYRGSGWAWSRGRCAPNPSDCGSPHSTAPNRPSHPHPDTPRLCPGLQALPPIRGG